jgi:hypothetical protein
MNKEEFLKFKELQAKLDERAKSICYLLERLKVFDVGWKNNLYNITYDSPTADEPHITFCTVGYYFNERCEDNFTCPLEYLFMTDEEIIDDIKKQRD